MKSEHLSPDCNSSQPFTRPKVSQTCVSVVYTSGNKSKTGADQRVSQSSLIPPHPLNFHLGCLFALEFLRIIKKLVGLIIHYCGNQFELWCLLYVMLFRNCLAFLPTDKFYRTLRKSLFWIIIYIMPQRLCKRPNSLELQMVFRRNARNGSDILTPFLDLCTASRTWYVNVRIMFEFGEEINALMLWLHWYPHWRLLIFVLT